MALCNDLVDNDGFDTPVILVLEEWSVAFNKLLTRLSVLFVLNVNEIEDEESSCSMFLSLDKDIVCVLLWCNLNGSLGAVVFLNMLRLEVSLWFVTVLVVLYLMISSTVNSARLI